MSLQEREIPKFARAIFNTCISGVHNMHFQKLYSRDSVISPLHIGTSSQNLDFECILQDVHTLFKFCSNLGIIKKVCKLYGYSVKFLPTNSFYDTINLKKKRQSSIKIFETFLQSGCGRFLRCTHLHTPWRLICHTEKQGGGGIHASLHIDQQ